MHSSYYLVNNLITHYGRTCMCKENNLPIVVFDMDTVGNLKKVIEGKEIGTVVHN